MRAEIREIFCPDVDDLEAWRPEDPESFGLAIQLMIGPVGGVGEESFELTVCSPGWLASNIPLGTALFGRHHLVMVEYDYRLLLDSLEKMVRQAEGTGWDDVAAMIARYASWEMEDYVEPEQVN